MSDASPPAQPQPPGSPRVPSPTPPAAKPRRRRRWLKRLLVAVAVLFLLALLTLVGSREYYRVVGNRDLERVTAELDAEDPGWRIEDLLAAHEARLPPAGQNSAEVVQATVEAWVAARRDRAAVIENPARPGVSGDVLPVPEWHKLPPSNYLPAADQLTELAEKLQPDTPALRTARRLASLPLGGSGLILPAIAFLPTPDHVDNAVIVAQLLWCESERAEAGGKPDEALETCLAVLNAGRSIGEEPLLQSQLARQRIGRITARTSVQILAWCQPGDGPLARLQAELAAESREPFLIRIARSERAVVYKTFDNARAGLVRPELDSWRQDRRAGRRFHTDSEMARGAIAEMAFDPPSDSLSRVAYWWHDRVIAGDQATYLRLMNSFVKLAQLPPHERTAAAEQLEAETRQLWATPFPQRVRYAWARLFSHGWAKLVTGATDFHAELSCAVVGIACERFRQARGRWPETLDEVPRDLLPEVPADGYDGRPLKYRRLADGVVIYSIGQDRKDDGGDLEIKPGRDRPPDLGVRLWNPDRRGLPPLPKPDPD